MFKKKAHNASKPFTFLIYLKYEITYMSLTAQGLYILLILEKSSVCAVF